MTEILIRSSSGKFYFSICAVDCQNVAAQVLAGETLRPGGFRETIYLLMMAGF